MPQKKKTPKSSLPCRTPSSVASGTFDIGTWYSTSWSNRKAITIDHTKVSGSSNLTNFPMLISLSSDSDLQSKAKTDGSDKVSSLRLRTETTKLNHEIEAYTSSTGQLIAWVQVPTVSPTGDTSIYIYYGNASATNQQNQTGVWDSGFKLVQHLQQTSGVTTYDSTSNGNSGTKGSATSPTATSAGEIGGAQSFNGSGDYIFNNGASSLPAFNGSQTISTWLYSYIRQLSRHRFWITVE